MADITTFIWMIAPALLVALTSFMLIKKMLAGEANRKNAELLMKSREQTIAMRLQAYERLVLFLERITFESLVLRVRRPDMRNQELQLALLSTIRDEFEHNLSQQLYVGNAVWESVKAAKESIVALVNEAAMKVKPDDPSMIIARTLLEQSTVSNMEEHTEALRLLKSEARKLF